MIRIRTKALKFSGIRLFRRIERESGQHSGAGRVDGERVARLLYLLDFPFRFFFPPPFLFYIPFRKGRGVKG